jgi:hypothetical protein
MVEINDITQIIAQIVAEITDIMNMMAEFMDEIC